MASSLVRRGSASLRVSPWAEEAAREFASNVLAPRTKAAYALNWRTFKEWCEQNGFAYLPAPPEVVCLFLAARAKAGIRPTSLALALAAISRAHQAAKVDSPTGSLEVRTMLAGIRRTVGAKPSRKAPLIAETLRTIVENLNVQTGLAALRDRALLLVGFAAALRREELVALTVRDVEFTPEGMWIVIRSSKTDQAGQGERLAIVKEADPSICPVEALRTWLEATRTTSGPLFRRISRAGQVGKKALTGRSVALIVKKHVGVDGLDPARFAGHSLRAGFATSAARAGHSELLIADQTRHRNMDILRGYVREANAFQKNAGKGLLSRRGRA